MCVGFVPFVEIDLGVVVSLFLLRITLPRLVRLFVRAFIITVSRVVIAACPGQPPKSLCSWTIPLASYANQAANGTAVPRRNYKAGRPFNKATEVC